MSLHVCLLFAVMQHLAVVGSDISTVVGQCIFVPNEVEVGLTSALAARWFENPGIL
jgi:hypothetical protein